MENTVFLLCSKNRVNKLAVLFDHHVRLDIAKLNEFLKKIGDISIDSKLIIDTFGRYAVIGFCVSLITGCDLIVRARGDTISIIGDKMRQAEGVKLKTRYWISKYIYKAVIQWADLILCCSYDLKTKLTSIGIRTDKVKVVYTPFTEARPREKNCNSFYKLDQTFRVLSVTNMKFRRKVLPTIRAITMWVGRRKMDMLDLEWIVAGDGHYRDEFIDEVKTNQMDDRVHVIGWVDNIGDLYSQADLFAHFTYLDGFPNAPMEAMSFNLPVVTNENSAGVREQVFDGFNGFVVSGSSDLFCALQYYKHSESVRRLHGRNGHKMLSNAWMPEKQKSKMQKMMF